MHKYKRPAPEVFCQPRMMYLVYDPGPERHCGGISIKPVFITKVTEHGYIRVAAINKRGTTPARWDDKAEWLEKYPDRAFDSGSWLFAEGKDAVAYYHQRLLQRAEYRRKLLAETEAQQAEFLILFKEGTSGGFTYFFDEQYLEQARLEVVRDYTFGVDKAAPGADKTMVAVVEVRGVDHWLKESYEPGSGRPDDVGFFTPDDIGQ